MLRRLLLFVFALLCAFGALGDVAAAQEEDSEPWSVGGTQLDPDREPIEGVVITVYTVDGEELGSDVTAADGTWNVELPGPGNYVAELDTSTLPDDVALRNEDNNPLSFTVRTLGRPKIIAFATGEDTRATVAVWRKLLQLAVDGVKFGLIIAMASMGLSLIFGTTGLTNFAHGELVTWGALVAWYVNVRIGWHLVPAAIVAVIIGGITGGLLDRLLWRPLRSRGTGLIAMLVVSIGLSLLVRYIFLFQFGGRTRGFKEYAVQRAWDLGPIGVAPKDLFSIVLSVVVLVLVALGLQRTRAGKAMRAVADNPDLASSSGIDVQRVILLVWMFGAGLAALGGILLAMSEQASFQMGFQLLLLMFAAVVLGGLGTAYGALVGGLVVGMMIQLSTYWIPSEMKNVGALFVLIVILVIRPQGILGSKERIG
ncbi:MAG TPA: branched-chain amino acid ABC transporter permease [Acidimicrobiales bacterium]|nr:branched-chain amino acid ABC transporter permease [Acidimicrobiales bacterium]